MKTADLAALMFLAAVPANEQQFRNVDRLRRCRLPIH
jgi:hypothetical protein